MCSDQGVSLHTFYGFPHFIAPAGSLSPVLDLLHLLANTRRETVEDRGGAFIGHSWNCCTSRLPMFHELNLNHMATLNCKGGGEISNGVHNAVFSVPSVPSAFSRIGWMLSKYH